MGEYSESPLWADVVPIAQDDGGPDPLAAIAYTEEYSEAMSYLRAIMAKNEMSERALELTEHIIEMNPAHYTVWLYRAKVIFSLEKPLNEEIEWLNSLYSGGSMKYLKNYQIWHHRQTLMSRIPRLPPTEIPFLTSMFAQDSKNYHIWSYRQWLVRHFSLWDTELPYVDDLLHMDIRNNSAWNHRYYIIFGRLTIETDGAHIIDEEVIDREIKYAKDAISKAPQNQSPWNYLRGVLKKGDRGLGELKGFALEFADVEREDEVRSSHALDFLADAFSAETDKVQAGKALELLAKRYDPIRRNYWNYKRALLGLAVIGT